MMLCPVAADVGVDDAAGRLGQPVEQRDEVFFDLAGGDEAAEALGGVAVLCHEQDAAGVRVEAVYRAEGVPEPPCGVIDTYIRRTGESIILRASYPTGAPSERAVTAYETVETVGGVAVVRCRPKTGRTHQLRVHFAALGCPIVGDDLYGGGFALPRQALHAARLDFVHPITGAPVVIECPLAPDLAAYLETLRKEDRHA